MRYSNTVKTAFNVSFESSQFDAACDVLMPSLISDWGSMKSALEIIRLEAEGEQMLTGYDFDECLHEVVCRLSVYC